MLFAAVDVDGQELRPCRTFLVEEVPTNHDLNRIAHDAVNLLGAKIHALRINAKREVYTSVLLDVQLARSVSIRRSRSGGQPKTTMFSLVHMENPIPVPTPRTRVSFPRDALSLSPITSCSRDLFLSVA